MFLIQLSGRKVKKLPEKPELVAKRHACTQLIHFLLSYLVSIYKDL